MMVGMQKDDWLTWRDDKVIGKATGFFFCRQGWTSVSMIGMTIGTEQNNESTESGKKDVGIIVQKGCWVGP